MSNKHFFDTCIWIELYALSTSGSTNKKRFKVISELYNNILNSKEEIVSCLQQIYELIQTIIKKKMDQYNKSRPKGNKGVGNFREYRKTEDYKLTLKLVKMIITELLKENKVTLIEFRNKEFFDKTFDELFIHLESIDLNDYLYYKICQTENIKLYTIDKDFCIFKANPNIIMLDVYD